MKRKPYLTDDPSLETLNEPVVAYATTRVPEERFTEKPSSESIYHLTDEQRHAIIQAQQEVARGKFFTNEEVQKAVELWANEN
jgi:predicted transcriptional regulator